MDKIIIGFIILILLFLICREIVTWYWKVNKRITLQEDTNLLLQKILIQLTANNGGQGKTHQPTVDKKTADKLYDLKNLLDTNMITAQEFEEEKKKLLSS